MMYHYFYNKNSSRKVLHSAGCHYLTNARCQEFIKKHSVKKAMKQGFTLCKHCMTIQNRFNVNYVQSYGAYRKYNYTYKCDKDCLEITTANGKWKILYAQNRAFLELYHQNKEIRDTDSSSLIPGYHCQNIQEYEFADIFDYICLHDGKLKTAPPKGTKRYNNMQKKNKEQQHKRAIEDTIRLIESLC